MPDVILHNVPLPLVARVQRVAASRHCSWEAAWVFLVDCGLAHTDLSSGLDAEHTRVLEEATIALRNLRNDPGFALIGRSPARPPAREPAPDQPIAPSWQLPQA